MSEPAVMIACPAPGCGAMNHASAVYCSRCGAELPHGDGDYELPIKGFEGTPDEVERQWFEKCYKGRGDTMLQLTWRAVLLGSLLGGILSLTNIYIGLKAGWGFGVAITACILSYAIWTTLYKLGIVKTQMTILENNCMQSTASSAGYSTGGTLISAFAAYIMLNNATLPLPLMFGWVFFLAVLGVTMAIPMKRQMINVEQLRFPSGVAAAETLRALHSHGDKGLRSAKALGIAGVLAAISKLWTEGLAVIWHVLEPFQLSAFFGKINAAVFGATWMSRTVLFSWEPMFIAAGAITGVRVCASMLIGGTLCWMVFVPIGLDENVITLTVTEKSANSLVDLDFRTTERLRRYAAYNDTIRTLKWEGIMTTEDRAALKALSSDPWYHSLIERLYVRSQFQARTPLATMPSVNLTGDLEGVVRYDARHAALEMPAVVAPDVVEKLRAAGGSPEFQAAVTALTERSILPSYEPLWAAVDLDEPKLKIPDNLAARLSYDASAKKLLWRGDLTDADRERIRAVSASPAFLAAVDALPAAVSSRKIEVPEALAAVVQYDAEVRALRARGALPTDATKTWSDQVKDDPAAAKAVASLVAASKAGRASENFRDIVAWTLWGGTACMVTSGLLAFLLQWKSAVRAFAGFFQMFGAARDSKRADIDAIETPTSWFIIGQVVSLIAISWLAHYSFGMPYWQSVLAVILTFALALVACRVTGETDTTPIGAMGKIMQLTFGIVHPAKTAGDVMAMNVNLMAANITAGAAGSSADLLTDLKSGYLLGAHPRRQFIAQFAGIFAGTIVTVLTFSVLVPDASVLGTTQFPAPAALTWKGVAEALSQGIGMLGPVKTWSIAIGGAVGIILPILSMTLPKRAQKFVPSAAGLALAWVFQWYYALLFFLGSILGWVIEKRWPKAAQEYTFPIAAGVIAGESLMGVALIFWENGPEMVRKFLGG
ncbi:MAG: OPT/YSL family transporter [Phycisphaerales bacterium]|nr:OPT/YSL family transporter [Phycisphaerales bacterium]